jgi:hypothetical protein
METLFPISTESEFQRWLVLLLESERRRMQEERTADQFASTEKRPLNESRRQSIDPGN